ncbi:MULTISPECIES: hypothetical protein [Streptomyces]|uniref:Uncharacterized protein n=1 Tax=Streptomyces ehimensis TaxID=68195 RepID=A0ABV9BH16_9ACTN
MFKKIRDAVEAEAYLMRDDNLMRKASNRGELLTIKPDGTRVRNEPDFDSRLFRWASGQSSK